MKLIIDIPDYKYRKIKALDTRKKNYTADVLSAIWAIQHGIELKKCKDCIYAEVADKNDNKISNK